MIESVPIRAIHRYVTLLPLKEYQHKNENISERKHTKQFHSFIEFSNLS